VPRHDVLHHAVTLPRALQKRQELFLEKKRVSRES
jgi:hypothetical protein